MQIPGSVIKSANIKLEKYDAENSKTRQADLKRDGNKIAPDTNSEFRDVFTRSDVSENERAAVYEGKRSDLKQHKNNRTSFEEPADQRQKAEAIIEEWQEQVSEIKGEKLDEKQENQNEQEEGSGDQYGSRGMVGINAGKLARMLAAAKTRSQVQAVIAKIRSDLNECEAGKNNGMDVDEASVKAAQQLLRQANALMGSAENREATPEEEMAAALAALM